MTKEKFEEIRKRHCILTCEVEDAIYFVQDFLELQIDELKQNEPYAVNSIRRLEEAASEVGNLVDYFDDIMED